MLIKAPYPEVQTTTLLPDPVLRNQESVQDVHDYKFMMNSAVRSYVKRTPKTLYIYNFLLTRQKAAELENFVIAYSGNQWLIIDHHGNTLIGYLVNSPFEFSFFGKHTGACNNGYSLNERATITLEFEA